MKIKCVHVFKGDMFLTKSELYTLLYVNEYPTRIIYTIMVSLHGQLQLRFPFDQRVSVNRGK